MHHQPRQLTLVAASLLAISPSALAATWCVNPNGTAGCKTTISAAVAAASAGDTIYVAHGTYKEGGRSLHSLAHQQSLTVTKPHP
jgi:hypothetical protein